MYKSWTGLFHRTPPQPPTPTQQLFFQVSDKHFWALIYVSFGSFLLLHLLLHQIVFFLRPALVFICTCHHLFLSNTLLLELSSGTRVHKSCLVIVRWEIYSDKSHSIYTNTAPQYSIRIRLDLECATGIVDEYIQLNIRQITVLLPIHLINYNHFCSKIVNTIINYRWGYDNRMRQL